MSKIYKFTVAIALFILAFVGFCFLVSYKGILLLGLLFFMPVVWTLWLACAAADLKIWKLILLWALIDIVVIGLASLMTGSVHGVGARVDTEFLFVIAFSPLIFPIILVSAFVPYIGIGLSALTRAAGNLLLPSGFVGVVPDWLGFSILSAISSCLFVSLFYFGRAAIERKRARTDHDHL
ncbi:hypothetical protein ACIPF8_12260 [Collimonas sp. NPDC087041]|uniref:hypothetical protein n=1 Tax=Collimonas sp. NPDC087041 TaxID=3363960 RepID=UPI003818A8DF